MFEVIRTVKLLDIRTDSFTATVFVTASSYIIIEIVSK